MVDWLRVSPCSYLYPLSNICYRMLECQQSMSTSLPECSKTLKSVKISIRTSRIATSTRPQQVSHSPCCCLTSHGISSLQTWSTSRCLMQGRGQEALRGYQCLCPLRSVLPPSPLLPLSKLLLQLEDFIPDVEEFYRNKHNGRKLTWHHILSNGVVSPTSNPSHFLFPVMHVTAGCVPESSGQI